MTDIKSMTLEEITAALQELGEPAFRAGRSSPGSTAGRSLSRI